MAGGVQCVMIVSLQVMLLLPVVSLDLMGILLSAMSVNLGKLIAHFHNSCMQYILIQYYSTCMNCMYNVTFSLSRQCTSYTTTCNLSLICILSSLLINAAISNRQALFQFC